LGPGYAFVSIFNDYACPSPGLSDLCRYHYTYRTITGVIQKAINDTIQHDEKPKLLGVRKPTKDGTIRIRCETEEEANMLRDMDWEAAVGGL
jgi:hypothetical protein